MTPQGVFFTVIVPLEINEQALCQQLLCKPKRFPLVINCLCGPIAGGGLLIVCVQLAMVIDRICHSRHLLP